MRKQSRPPAIQPKAATFAPKPKQPTAPPAYHPQPVPKVLQTKMAADSQQSVGKPPRQPLAPPVYRPEPRKIVQPKLAVTTPGHMPTKAAAQNLTGLSQKQNIVAQPKPPGSQLIQRSTATSGLKPSASGRVIQPYSSDSGAMIYAGGYEAHIDEERAYFGENYKTTGGESLVSSNVGNISSALVYFTDEDGSQDFFEVTPDISGNPVFSPKDLNNLPKGINIKPGEQYYPKQEISGYKGEKRSIDCSERKTIKKLKKEIEKLNKHFKDPRPTVYLFSEHLPCAECRRSRIVNFLATFPNVELFVHYKGWYASDNVGNWESDQKQNGWYVHAFRKPTPRGDIKPPPKGWTVVGRK
ncbi:MAG: hypothetical protein ICV60_19725 [Pyrinomonadaceae bacterium]|nr:hypothetical protein [Pyrinomonadaceae bacterium]